MQPSQTYTRGADVTIRAFWRAPKPWKIAWELWVWRFTALVWMAAAIKAGAVHFA